MSSVTPDPTVRSVPLSEALAPVKACIPDEAKDLRLNLGGVIERSPLAIDEAWGPRSPRPSWPARWIRGGVRQRRRAARRPGGRARTAAALMAMNTTWYPFVELADDLELENVPAGLRMNADGTHGGVGKERFELYALAAAVVGKCHNCIASHTAELRKAGRSTEEIAAVGRIAAVVHGVAVVLDTMALTA